MNPLNNLKNEAQQIRLSSEEKAVMRANIFGAPSLTRVQKSPYVTVSHYSWFSARFVTAMAAFLIVVLGSGTVYAAQGALPGDVLYVVKTSVAEPVRTTLAFSSEAKLSVHMAIAEERLEEAQALAAEGRLSKEVVVEIESSLESHVQEAEVLAQKLEEVDPEAAVEISATLSERLAVNGAILASLGDESDDEDTKENSRSLAGKARSRIAYARDVGGSGDASASFALMAPGQEAEDSSALMATNESASDVSVSAKIAAPVPEATPGLIKAAEQLEKKAEEAMADVEEQFNRATDSLGATTTDRITLELRSFDERFESGDTLEASGDYRAARELYTSLYTDILALSSFVRAEQRFNKKIINSLINERFGVRTIDMRTGREDTEYEDKNDGDVRGAHTDADSDNHEDGDDTNSKSDKKREDSGKKGDD